MRLLAVITALSGVASAVPLAGAELESSSSQAGSVETRRVLGTYYAAPDGNGIYLIPNDGSEQFVPLQRRGAQAAAPWKPAQPLQAGAPPPAPEFHPENPYLQSLSYFPQVQPQYSDAGTAAQSDPEETSTGRFPWWLPQLPTATWAAPPVQTDTITLIMQAPTVTITSTAIDLCLLPPETNSYPTSSSTGGALPTPASPAAPIANIPTGDDVFVTVTTTVPGAGPSNATSAACPAQITQTVPGPTVTITKTEITTTTVMITVTKEGPTVTVTAAVSGAANASVSAVTKWFTAVTTVNLCSAVNLCAAFPSNGSAHSPSR